MANVIEERLGFPELVRKSDYVNWMVIKSGQPYIIEGGVLTCVCVLFFFKSWKIYMYSL